MLRVLAFVPLLGLATAAEAQLPHFAMHVGLDATLDPLHHAVDGVEHLHWVNESRAPATDLYFHLYLNAFASNRTVFMRESGGMLRGVSAPGSGGIDVTSIRDAAGRELRAAARIDLVADDATQMRLPLAQPVPPGGALDLEIHFRSRLPPVFARSGWVGDFHMVAQWFPKLAVREPDGRWATFPYHGNGEFYGDFADWDLTIRAPREFVIGACGEELPSRRDGERTVHHFVARAVHDVAFTAWPDFLEHTFDERGVRVRVLFPPGYENVVRTHEDVVRAGLRQYGARYGAYPYPTLTVVLPPRGAEGAEGMEYPTLIVSGGPWLAVPGVYTPFPDDVTAHELAHQWFYGLMASDEVTWPMLDEGMTQWATSHFLADRHGEARSAVGLGSLHADDFELQRILSLRTEPLAPPPALPAYAYGTGGYGRSVYGRTALALETVRRTFGARRFDAALALYARQQRFHHPVPADLFAAFDDAYGDPTFSARVLRPMLVDGALVDARLVSLDSVPSGGAYRTDITAQRDGTLALPLWISLRDAHGEVTRIPWRSPEPRLRATWTSARPIVEARLDPDRHDLLQRSRDADRIAPRAGGGGLFARLLFVIASVIAAVGP